MRKAFIGILGACVIALGLNQLALATNRSVVYPNQNPDVVQTNQAWRYQRLADGTVLRDLLGTLNLSGAWSSLNVVGVSGSLNVEVVPSSSPGGQAGMIYQVLPDDPSPVPYVCPTGFPCSGYQLSADSTQIVIPALVAATSAPIGPLNCNGCTSGQATSYLIEAQIQTAPGNNRSMMFVSSSGAVSFPNVNTEVDDTVAYASVQGGTAAFSTTSPSPGASPNPTPNMPSPAAGWIPLAYVQSYFGGTSCATSCTITMAYTSQFQAATFSIVTFGGHFAQSGGVTPSQLTTQNTFGCGVPDALGMDVDNATGGNGAGFILPGTHMLRVDQAGDLAVCGAKLIINSANGQNSEVPEMIFNTTVDQPSGTPSPEALYPASNVASEVTSGSCSANTDCAVNSTATICAHAGFPNAPLTSIDLATTGAYAAQVQIHAVFVGSGFALYPYNTGGSPPGPIPNNTTIKIHYVCL